MRKGNKNIMIGLLWSILFCMGSGALLPMTVQAASKKKIKSVSIVVKADIEMGTDIGQEEIEIETRSSKYYCSDYIIENDGFEWEEDTIPELTITLEAEDGYYFALTHKDDVKIKGAEYISARRENSSQSLSLKVKIPEYLEQVKDVEAATWGDDVETAEWIPAFGATKYYVQLYCNGTKMGRKKTVSDSYMNCRRYMTKPGSYTYTVQPYNTKDGYINNKGEVTECYQAVNVSAEQASENREYVEELKKLEGTAFEYGTDGPGSRAKGWYQEDSGWWYSDGARRVKNQWLSDQGKWYYFDENGYMVIGWRLIGEEYYYFGNDGGMYSDTITPDGYTVDSSGKYIS